MVTPKAAPACRACCRCASRAAAPRTCCCCWTARESPARPGRPAPAAPSPPRTCWSPWAAAPPRRARRCGSAWATPPPRRTWTPPSPPSPRRWRSSRRRRPPGDRRGPAGGVRGTPRGSPGQKAPKGVPRLNNPKVLVAMSGGVDSSVAAALAVEAGWDVTGVHLKLADTPAHLQVQGKGCCTLADADDARRVADTLGIPFYVWDFTERFQEAVVADFAAEYARGRTPNPCARCNERVKVVGLLERARALGFDGLATGHYARVADGRPYRAADHAK